MTAAVVAPAISHQWRQPPLNAGSPASHKRFRRKSEATAVSPSMRPTGVVTVVKFCFRSTPRPDGRWWRPAMAANPIRCPTRAAGPIRGALRLFAPGACDPRTAAQCEQGGKRTSSPRQGSKLCHEPCREKCDPSLQHSCHETALALNGARFRRGIRRS
jgi:hypothetical protein